MSDYFDVITGPAAQIAFAQGYEPAFTPKFSGEFFQVPPRLRLLDAGGNFVSTDNSSALQVSIRHNPTGRARIGPKESLFVVARQGIVSFNALSIDTQGYNYTLQFTLWRYSAPDQRHIETDITVTSEKFDVLFGPPRKLVFAPGPHSKADGAWAGNQPFTQQPVLQLQDFGGNPRRPDFTSTVTASIVPSLSVGLHDNVLIDTSDAPQTAVLNVSLLSLQDGVYGAGHVIDITVTFAVNVWVTDAAALQLNDPVTVDLPYLLLNISNSRTGDTEALAYLTGVHKQTKALIFRYVVQPGDTTAGLPLDCAGPAALVLNRTALVDGNARAVDTSLSSPLLSVQHAVEIDTAAPGVVQIEVDTADGEYGAGQEILFSLTFDMPVVVEGFPFLLLSAINSTGHGGVNASLVPAVATYTRSSGDDHVLHFLYAVREGEATEPGDYLSFLADSIQVSNVTRNNTIVSYIETELVQYNASAVNATINGTDYNISAHYRYGYEFTNRVAAFIRRRSDTPTTLANYSLGGLVDLFASQHSIGIDTTPPQLDASYGLQTSHADGTYYPGEYIYLTVRFDKPVVVSGVGIYLDMDAGPHGSSDATDYLGYAYIKRLLPDGVTVEFLYIVEKNVNTTRLDIQPGATSLVVPEETAFIRRASTHPITSANVNTSWVHASSAALRNSAALEVIGFPPVVLSTLLLSTSPPAAAVLYPDDFALIEVIFSAPVVSTCSPVLVMAAKYFRAAEYVSGNNTDTYVFKYTVQMGDEAASLQYRHTPYPICPVLGCPQRTNCQMLANSTVPSLPVFLKSFRTGSVADLIGGVTIAAIAVAPQTLLRDTTVAAITCAQPAGEYGAGSVLDFLVTFSDTVILPNTTTEALPRLYLDIGKFALYGGGNYGKVLKFTYVTTEADVLTGVELLPALIGATASALFCDAAKNCELLNQAGDAVDLDTAPANFAPTGITLDPTTPVVTGIFTDKQTSPFQEGQYTVGEKIFIFVTVSKPVIVTGFDPRIELNVTHPERFALYNATLSTPTQLAFVYQVREGDQSLDLSYKNPFIDLYGDNCRIYRLSSIPTTLMDVTLPPPTKLATVGNVVHIDTLDIPYITNVTSLPSDRLVDTEGVLFAGDEVILRVDFDREVIAVGSSYINMNAGDHVRRAWYVGHYAGDLDLTDSVVAPDDYEITPALPNSVSNATRHLFYRYEVLEGDFSDDLDYTDVFALLPGMTANNDVGYIASASSEARLPVNLELPRPSAPGSLSADNALLKVDGRAPYVTGLNILTPPGTYSTSSSILIGMNFSAPVYVEGVPSIKLETGLVDNSAVYISGSGTASLLFRYTPEPGDVSTDLDYHADRARFSSAAASFNYNGGRILQFSSRPFLPAEIWLNPPHGSLLGQLTETAISGVFRFLNLQIDWRGPDYQIRYSTEVPETGTTLTFTQQPLDVSFSSERQLRPARALKGQRVGHAVDIDGDLAVLGCPNCNSSVTTIQAVVTSASEGEIVREVQLLQTIIEAQPAIQSFHTTAAVNSAVGGGFKLSHGTLGFTQLIPANADYRVLEAIIRFDLPSLGNVTVNREAYIFCACDNAYTWTLTFNDIAVGTFSPLILDGTSLTGSNVGIVGPTILQSPALLGGTFTLSAVGLTTAPIPFDANVARMTSAIAELGIPVFDIFMYPTEATRTRSWSITFDAYLDSYEMPPITPDSSELTGGDTSLLLKTTRPGRHGPFGIAGFFALSLRGNTTRLLRASCTAAEMKAALEELPVINYVNVNRTVTPVLYGYTWTIEFVSVNVNSPRGLVLQEISNVEALVATNQLIATQPVIDVQARYALGSRNQITGLARQGTYGSGAGAVHVYQRRNETWDEMATLRANDTAENNFFGGSVSLFGDVLLVGAVGASMNGRPEKQSIFCSAVNGTFRIHFRGWSTDEIRYDVTREELLEAVVSDPRVFDKLYTVTALDIADWGGGPLCANNTAVLTFYSPVDGAELLLGSDTGPDLELLTLEPVDLLGYDGDSGTIIVAEVQAGTWRLHNVDSDPQQIGAAYVFRAEYDCDGASELCRKSKWVQEAQLFPIISRAGSLFGKAVALSAEVAIIGAPGSLDEKGTAYVYQYDAVTKQWNFLQLMVSPLVVAGDRFGTSVAVSGDTAIVAASGYMNGIGGVFTFRRTTAGGAFIAAQTLIPSPTLFTLSVGDLYGSSLSIEDNIVAIGAPGYNDNTVYFGDQRSPTVRTKSGAVFTFERVSPAFNFKFQQKLKPSNVQEFDGFGHSVDLSGKNLVVSSLQESELADSHADKPIIEVITHAKYDEENLAGSFKLKWLTADSGATYTTRFILHDASAAVMRDILEADLPTGPLLVTRSRVDVYDGGYAWSITFLDYDAPVPLFQTDTAKLIGADAGVSVRYINPSPNPLRGKAHLFQRPAAPFSTFVEQMFLSPHIHQAADRCGESARISGKYALIGCPNRDLRVPTQNSGAGFVFHLGLLAVQYTEKYTVFEGRTAPIQVVHDAVNIADLDQDLFFFTQTLDRNAFAPMQRYIRHLFGIPVVTASYPDSMLDRTLLVGKAIARTQYYGSEHNESRWVDGMYDYRAVSDYVPLKHPKAFLIEYDAVSDAVITTGDSIYETPDERIILAISSPGVWPSVFGRLYGQIRIYDPADGNVWEKPRYRKMYDSTSIATEGISAASTAAAIASTSPSSSGSIAESGAEYAHSVAYNEELGVMIVGVPTATVHERKRAGKAVIYHRNSGGNWTQSAQFFSPFPALLGTRFGDAVAVNRIYERNISILAIGEPSLNRVYVYVSQGNNVGENYVLDTVLFCDSTGNSTSGYDSTSISATQRFGERGSVALYGFMLVVAAPALESAWVYRRVYSPSSNSWGWSEPTMLRSVDYDFDVIQGAAYLHRQDFGQAVAVHERSIVIGAPFADYGNIGTRNKFGTNLIETQWDTEGTSMLSYARGRAYVFYSAPSTQEIRIFSAQRLYFGEFQLTYFHEGTNETTTSLRFNAAPAEMQEALLALSNIDDISVSASSLETSTGFLYAWTVTFVSDWQEQDGVLYPLYFGNGCEDCVEFSVFAENNSTEVEGTLLSFTTAVLEERQPFAQVQALSADDRRNGDRFGAAVAVDGDTVVVGAPTSATMTTTTWNFEAGRLLGWHRTGDAFDFQPTYGDNSYLRGVREGRQGSGRLRAQAKSSGLEGYYYIGTYEKRPGDPLNYRSAHPLYPEGSIQGDEPRGTLSSDVFIVRGDKISFLVGGGCDIYLEYVELLVDGMSVSKHTGQCSEKMRPVHFDVGLFRQRAAQIRIVDNSTANWGHINVDHFQFDWDVMGGTIPSKNAKTTHGGVAESPVSGAAYIFHRVGGAAQTEKCFAADKRQCSWVQEVRLAVSDKRQDMLFGSTVAANDRAGLVLVGAPGASFTGFYKEDPAVFPYLNASDYSTVANLQFPVDPAGMLLFQSTPAAIPQRSGAYGVWSLQQDQDQDQQGAFADPKAWEKAGAVYAYVKQHEKLASDGAVIRPQFWSRIEQAKVQPPDAAARDVFGASFALSGMSVVVGAPGQDGLLRDAGAVYVYSTEFAALSFSAVSFFYFLGVLTDFWQIV